MPEWGGGIRCLIQLALYSIRRRKKKINAFLSLYPRFEFCAEVKARRGTIEQCSAESLWFGKKEKLVDVSENKRCSLEMVTRSDSL